MSLKHFERLLTTTRDPTKVKETLKIIHEHPEVAQLEWSGGDDDYKPYIKGATALHYAAENGCLEVVIALLEKGAHPNASNAIWFPSVLAWAANNGHIDVVKYLHRNGTNIKGIHALHAAAWGGSQRGKVNTDGYLETIKFLVDNGADINDVRFIHETPLDSAIKSGFKEAEELIRSLGGVNYTKIIEIDDV